MERLPVLRQSIKTATRSDLIFPMSLMARNSDSLGFLPRKALEFYAGHRGIRIKMIGLCPVGFICYTTAKRTTPAAAHIYQVGVENSHRRCDIGTELVMVAEDDARDAGADIMECWVATDLPAMNFWHACGYKTAETRVGGNRRKRTHQRFVKELK